jgi:hypothetical protein
MKFVSPGIEMWTARIPHMIREEPSLNDSGQLAHQTLIFWISTCETQ